MVNIQLRQSEREIFKFRVVSLKSVVEPPIGYLIITDQRIIFKPSRLKQQKKYKEREFELATTKVKYKRQSKSCPCILINKIHPYALDIYNNKLVAKWLSNLINLAQKAKSKGKDLQIPTKIPIFIKDLENQQEHMAAYLPPIQNKVIAKREDKITQKSGFEESQQKSTNRMELVSIKEILNQNPSDLKKKCPHCAAKIAQTAKFCVHCGLQIED